MSLAGSATSSFCYNSGMATHNRIDLVEFPVESAVLAE